jgi:DtxR family Mn-dependent transcriptional regulator
MKQTDKPKTSSMEDYLKAIARLSQEDSNATVTSISKLLKVKKPSVTSALVRLAKKGLVVHKRYGTVELTPEGIEAARDVNRRHQTLHHLLVDILKVDPEIAEDDAHRMEHSLSRSSLERLDQFIEFTMNRPVGMPGDLEGFNNYLQHGCINKNGYSLAARRMLKPKRKTSG